MWYTSCGTEQPSRYAAHTIPSALLYFGTVCQTGVLYLSILAWRLGHGPLNQTRCFCGRKTEEKEIRDAEQAKVKFLIQTVQKRGPSCLSARYYILLKMTSLRSKHKQTQSWFHQWTLTWFCCFLLLQDYRFSERYCWIFEYSAMSHHAIYTYGLNPTEKRACDTLYL